MAQKYQFLILTAAFGEGHNSAAKNLALALNSMGAETRIEDPFLSATPKFTAFLQYIYRIITTYVPSMFGVFYRQSEKKDFSQDTSLFLKKPEQYVQHLIEESLPSAIICTYPVYLYFLERYFLKQNTKIPVFTMITDSIEVHSVWYKAASDYFLLTDATTREKLANLGIEKNRLIETGFAVNPKFSELTPIDACDSVDEFRVLYFPTAKRSLLINQGRILLENFPEVRLSLALGKNLRRLYKEALMLKAEYPGRVRLYGWTKKIPELLNHHHLVIGKAGGATVHEAIAARCPMLIHHLVPGQEEGNLQLLEKLGAGALATKPEDLKRILQELRAEDYAKWREWKSALVKHDRHDGAMNAAQFIFSKI